jgi:hypothetical protein
MTMEFISEQYAKDLYDDLMRRFSDHAKATAITLGGRGTQWHCKAERDEWACTIYCFDVLEEPEYLMWFARGSAVIARGRTCLKHQVIEAVEDWLQHKDLVKIYARFAFIDQGKRALASLRNDVVARFPQLEEPVINDVEHRLEDIYYLWFRLGDRSCCISFYGRNEFPDAVFHWDECEQFRFKADDRSRLADVLKRWIADRAMPSAMRAEFPWLEIKRVADYYEQGKPIEGEFIQSWNDTERFYTEMEFSWGQEVRDFIRQMRARGHDRTLRAGQSMWSFILSRSRRHHLKPGQPSIAFSFGEHGIGAIVDFGEEKELSFQKIELTPEIDALLHELEAKDIS